MQVMIKNKVKDFTQVPLKSGWHYQDATKTELF